MDKLMDSVNTGTRWRQVNLWCDDWQAAEQMAVAHLGPRLTDVGRAEILTSWWFVRKGASWRLRCLPAPGQDEQATAVLEQTMQDLKTQGAIHRWAATIYEPEIHAFGGAAAMDFAHDLFHADSRHLLDHLQQARKDHRRELGLLLGSRLMRAAGLDWYEQGDIWAQVAAHRSTGHPPPQRPSPAAAAVRQLITASTDGEGSPLRAAPAWPAAFQQAGQGLAELAHQGTLTRGLRAVLTHHVLFAWNRAGIPAQLQADLAATASQVVFQQEPAHDTGPIPDLPVRPEVRLNTVTTDTTHTTTPESERLRAALVDELRGHGVIQTPQVEDAFRAVERHRFLPDADLKTAYTAQVVVTKRATDGAALSSASHPSIVAAMLEQLDVQPGHQVLEIGAGTGINAALLQELVGPTGRVVTIDIDDDVVAGARHGLSSAGYDRVEVICGDGADGYSSGAPYDRITVTAGAWDVVPAWWRQLAVGGRMVVPLVLHGSGLTRAVAFDYQQAERMVSSSAQVCGFVAMRGSAAHAGHTLQLAEDVTLQLDAGSPVDDAALGQALTYPRDEHWTGVVIGDGQPVEHLDLWLASTSNRFSRLHAGPRARESGLVTPALRWGGAALYDEGTFAYLTLRPHTNGTVELGVISHGPGSRRLADQTVEHLHIWDRERPTQPVITAHPAGTPDDQLPQGYRVEKPDSRLTISW